MPLKIAETLIGILTYDPCIGEYVTVQQQIPALPFVQQNNNVLGLNKSYLSTLENLDKSCGYAKYREEFLTFPPNKTQPPLYFNSTSNPDCDLWGSVYDASYAPNPCFNVYEIGSQCPLLGDPLGYPTDLQYSYPGTPVYFNRTDVKKAMHAPMEVDWLECAGPVFVGNGGPQGEGDLSPDPIQKVLPRVIEATNRVLVANGDLDLEILTNGTLLAIQNMTWNGKMGVQKAPSTPINIKLRDLEYEAVFTASGFGDIDDPQGVMGIQHYERGLLWAETYLSGHMEPQFQPR
jgi:carboxypeptidase D